MPIFISSAALRFAVVLSLAGGIASAAWGTPAQPLAEGVAQFRAEAFSSVRYESVDPNDLSQQGKFVPLVVAYVAAARVATAVAPVLAKCTKKPDGCYESGKKVVNAVKHPIETAKNEWAKVKENTIKAKAVVVKATCKAGKKC